MLAMTCGQAIDKLTENWLTRKRIATDNVANSIYKNNDIMGVTSGRSPVKNTRKGRLMSALL